MLRHTVACLAVVALMAPAYGQQIHYSISPGWAGGPGGGTNTYATLYYGVNNKSAVLYGQVPMVYKILGLTEEQMKSIQDICNKAKDEWSEWQKASPRPAQGQGGADAQAAYREYNEKVNAKREELSTKYTGRIGEILTDKDRAQLKKIEDAVQKKTQADEKARTVYQKAQEESFLALEKDLDQTLTDAQKAKVKELGATSRAGGGSHSFKVIQGQ